MVELIADDGIAVAEPDRAGWKRGGIASFLCVGEVLPHNLVARVYLDDAAVVRVGDESISTRQPAGEGHSAYRSSGRERRHDLFRPRHLDRSIVVLVGDQDVSVDQQLGAIRTVELIGTDPANARCSVLPDDSVIV